MSVNLPLADELSAVFARLSGLLLTQETVRTSVGLAARLAHETMHASVGAGVTLVDELGRKSTAQATDRRVERVDQLQYDLEEGPCLTAYVERAVVRIPDTASDARFPRWSPVASGLGVAATLSAPLVVGDECLGAMKVYADTPGAFDAHAQRLLPLFAAQAAIMLANVQAYEKAERVSAQLRDALHSRDAISTAKGIVMARDRVNEQEAFRILVSTSSREGRKLSDVAQALVAAVQRRNR